MENKWTRRQAIRAALILGTLGTFFSQAAVSCGNLFTNILRYVSIGLSGFTSIVNILIGAGIVPVGTGTSVGVVIALVKAGFADLQTAVDAYNAAATADKKNLEQKIAIVLQDLQNEITVFWNNLNIPDPKLALLIQGLLEVITTTLAAFSSQLPPASTSSSAAMAPMMRAKRLAMVPHTRSEKQFKDDFNSILHANGYDQFAIR